MHIRKTMMPNFTWNNFEWLIVDFFCLTVYILVVEILFFLNRRFPVNYIIFITVDWNFLTQFSTKRYEIDTIFIVNWRCIWPVRDNLDTHICVFELHSIDWLMLFWKVFISELFCNVRKPMLLCRLPRNTFDCQKMTIILLTSTKRMWLSVIVVFISARIVFLSNNTDLKSSWRRMVFTDLFTPLALCLVFEFSPSL